MGLVTDYSDGNISGQEQSFEDKIKIRGVKFRFHHIPDLLGPDMHSRLFYEIAEQIDFIEPDHFE